MIIADAHVHIHSCFQPDHFLRSAFENMSVFAPVRNNDEPVSKVLFLTESAGVDVFADWRSGEGKSFFPKNWSFHDTDEACSILCLGQQQERLWIIRGRQVVTSERLEVLALGVADVVQDGLPMVDTVAYVRERGGVPVLPWGFGKWIGHRGDIVADYISGLTGEDGVFIGDNGNRINCWPSPGLFREAGNRGIYLLPGSDPLPFVSQQKRVGSFGFILDCRLDKAEPFNSIFSHLKDLKTPPRVFGYRENPVNFVYFQAAIQFRKKFRKPDGG